MAELGEYCSRCGREAPPFGPEDSPEGAAAQGWLILRVGPEFQSLVCPDCIEPEEREALKGDAAEEHDRDTERWFEEGGA